MGKKDKKSKGAAASKSDPKCTCEHPYKCNCGNRPPRPSKGHMWDPEAQQWGGKGHKQKGGSGQTALVGAEAKTTAIGQTQVAQWQRLPSALLTDFCKKQKRPPPKFKSLLKDQNKSKFKVRVIVPDGKDSNKDLIIVPAKPVANEEQAKEESSLLALLQLTPNLPHERKLPEPYKTTWTAAIQSLKEKDSKNAKRQIANSNGDIKPEASSTSNPSSGGKGATSNTNLTLGTAYTSQAEKRKMAAERKKLRNARIRKHEAIRMANRDHPVFLSASLRTKIQRLLKGETNLAMEDPSEDDSELEPFESDRQAYVEERLHQEGFTQRQARSAFLDQSRTNKHEKDTDDEELWEDMYDDCLQWLCIQLDEDQLPEGFDPRGATLEVIPKSGSKKDQGNQSISSETRKFLADYGLLEQDAAPLMSQKESKSMDDIFWEKVCEVANVSLSSNATPSAENKQAFEEEMEAIEAIFPSDCTVRTADECTSVVIKTPEELILTIVFVSSQYPSAFPQRVLVSGNWPKPIGAAFHVELVKFISTLTLGEPMVFEIYGQMQVLLQKAEELQEMSLTLNETPSVPLKSPDSTDKYPEKQQQRSINEKISVHKTFKRPRARGGFWSSPPNKTPAATPFPTISKSLRTCRLELPAGKARSDFLARMKEADNSSRVVLVTGDTGCGKTTQIPQFILEEAPEGAKIVVAQPRRLAATGVAGRVAQERGEGKPGTGSVGYVVRGGSAYCNSTRLLFCTFGILLRQLQCDGALDCITHIVIDEVHERNLDGDVLMALLRKAIKTTPNLRVVLMSATLDAERFAAYWGENTPRMHIPGRTFPVEDFTLEDVLDLTNYNPPKKGRNKFFNHSRQSRPRKATPWNDSEMSDNENENEEDDESSQGKPKTDLKDGGNIPALEERLKRVDEAHVDYNMLGLLVKYLIQQNTMGNDGSILVFLPGAPEISQAISAIERITRGLRVLLLPLHGGLQPKQQNAVFQNSGNSTKVILSTNVAETSITIPDCTVVIDSCREKQSTYDPNNRMPMLVEHFASKASLKQRRGRAGRVRAGKCYKLISKSTHSGLREHTAPEITRCALDQTLLSLMFLGVERGDGKFLNSLLDPPSQGSIDAAIFSLWKVGALEQGVGRNELRLTPLGMHLAGIPAPPVVGKILVMGSILGCRKAALAMAAGMSTGRSPFLKVDIRSNQGDNSADSMRRVLDERAKLLELTGNSDHAMLATAFVQWDGLKTGGGDRKQFCESLGLSLMAMRDILQLVNQYDASLSSAGFGKSSDSDRNSKSFRILRTCAISSMAPGQLVRLQRPTTKYSETAEGAREKDGVAKELKFFIRNEEAVVPWQSRSSGLEGPTEERVFIHPSSALFSTGNYSCPWLVYHSLVKTSKPFLRDATECSAYALLLFGGQLDVQARNDVIVVDGWVKLAANARIGALIRGLRGRMDDLLEEKIKDPGADISSTPEMRLIVKLLITDGLGS
eukprot:scaffold1184_cov132-Cylindrotheca_fusiformis.AAC.11